MHNQETGRIEAFSDGVFAIALTLLILDIHVPHELPAETQLLDALWQQWPTYIAFIMGFSTIGIMWINHHRLFNLIKRSDHWLLVFNTMLLFGITIVPFPTSLVAQYFGHPGEQTAALVYSAMGILIAILFNLLWRYASYKNRLLDKGIDPEAVRAVNRAYAAGPLFYALAFAVAFVSVTATIAITIGLAIFFALPPRNSRLH